MYTLPEHIDPLDGDSGLCTVVIDTPRGSRVKFKYDEKIATFRVRKLLPVGSMFPWHFGFIPGTRGADGDPIDALVLLDEPLFVGCFVDIRLIGALCAQQTERSGERMRNDRLIGVVETEVNHSRLRSLDDLDLGVVDQIEHFFVSYNSFEGKRFVVERRASADEALQLVRQSLEHRSGGAEHHVV